MKSQLLKAVLLSLCLLMTLSAHAAWRCKSHNFKGDSWFGFGITRADAVKNARVMCMSGPATRFARNCKIEMCEPITVWQCNVVNRRHQMWSGLAYTKQRAANRAYNLCRKGSVNPQNCQITKCFIRS